MLNLTLCVIYCWIPINSVEFDTMKRAYAELSEISLTEAEMRCATVMALVHKNGEVDNRTIANTLGIDMKTIQRTCKKLEKSKDLHGVITRAPKSLDDRHKLRNADFVKRVEAMININPSKSMKSMAAELGVDKRTIQRCVDKDLCCKSYRMQTGQLLTQATKDKRLLNSTKLLNKLKHLKESNMLWFFSDEKNFCQDQGPQQAEPLMDCYVPNDVPRVMKTKFPNTVMIFGVISSDRDVMPPHIFETSLRVDTEIYLQVMETVVLSWIKQVAQDGPWVWQQDSAPCHVSKCSFTWLE